MGCSDLQGKLMRIPYAVNPQEDKLQRRSTGWIKLYNGALPILSRKKTHLLNETILKMCFLLVLCFQQGH